MSQARIFVFVCVCFRVAELRRSDVHSRRPCWNYVGKAPLKKHRNLGLSLRRGLRLFRSSLRGRDSVTLKSWRFCTLIRKSSKQQLNKGYMRKLALFEILHEKKGDFVSPSSVFDFFKYSSGARALPPFLSRNRRRWPTYSTKGSISSLNYSFFTFYNIS